MPDAYTPDRPLILLVEENEHQCESLYALLLANDFFVLRARDAREARQLSGAYPFHISLLLTHIRLRGMSGPDLARYLRLRSPGMGVLYMSESLSEMMELTEPEEFLSSLLPAPFSPETLVHRVRILVAADV